jgi:uncharacterized protein YyaL (SSP411 family)
MIPVLLGVPGAHAERSPLDGTRLSTSPEKRLSRHMETPPKEKKLNHLAGETSPYLQQHASNPVDWYPWGDEALRKAKELDRPIFLSIGYSSCHWCHVMERESFEDAEIAKILNESFISIKVDREERPDLDAVYMAAVQMLTGRGGWPLSVFLTPDLRPFWGGTYFPPEARSGLPGFGQVLTQIAAAYKDQRERIDVASVELTQQLQAAEKTEAGRDLPGKEALDEAVRVAEETFDSENGGFGSAPKFPRALEISVLLRCHRRSKDPRVLHVCEKTLEGMALGGMYDQIGGGFHRYSTDERWLIPHFEKMLYDNALLARTYVEAHQATGKPFPAGIARETLDYVLREMTSPEGGFFSATDADSEGEEGKFFVWTPDQVEQVLGPQRARVICEWFNITLGGNFEHRTSVPHVRKGLDGAARALRMDPSEFARIVREGKEALRAARDTRVKPFKDEKIIASWNGLMISALARAYQVLGDERYLAAAQKAARFVEDKMVVKGRLHRTFKDGRTGALAYLDDHAHLIEAFLDLHEATFNLGYLMRARSWADTVLADFWDKDEKSFFLSAPQHGSPIHRKKDALDGSTPSGGGASACNLLRLGRLTGSAVYRRTALDFLKGVKVMVEKYPAAFASSLMALDDLLDPPLDIAIVGDSRSPATRDLLKEVHRRFLPGRVLAGAASPVDPEAAREVPLLEGKKAADGKATAYVCRNFTCSPPVTSPPELGALLDAVP